MKKSKNYNTRDFNCSNHECNDDLVGGELLEIAKEFERLSVTVSEILTPFYYPCMTTSRFMQEGVRTNGLLERSGNLSKLFNKSTDYLFGLDRMEKDIKDRRGKVHKMLKLLDNYQICSECNGDGGELLGPNFWEDCFECDGQGMVKKFD